MKAKWPAVVLTCVLAITFSTVIALTTFYWGPLTVLRSPIAAIIWGLIVGIPSGVAVTMNILNSRER